LNLKKFSMIIFITGVLISVFSGSFDVLDEMQLVKMAVLMFLGIIVGMMNISEQQERDFLLASIAFIFGSQVITSTMNQHNFLGNLSIMLDNLVIFIAPASVVIALKKIFTFGSESDMDLHLDMPKKEDKHFLEEIWDIILLMAVAVVFVILILESFFNVAEIQTWLDITDLAITIIFVVDLIILFRKSSNFMEFIKLNWVDILAVIPLGSIFRIAKVIRAVRIIKVLSRMQKATKVAKTSSAIAKSNRFLKFFSKNSGFNKYVHHNSSSGKKKTTIKKKK
jgi:hypothetical protein